MKEIAGQREGGGRIFGTRVFRVGEREGRGFGRLPQLPKALGIVTMQPGRIFELAEVDRPHPRSNG